jgi:hypothetical protein
MKTASKMIISLIILFVYVIGSMVFRELYGPVTPFWGIVLVTPVVIILFCIIFLEERTDKNDNNTNQKKETFISKREIKLRKSFELSKKGKTLCIIERVLALGLMGFIISTFCTFLYCLIPLIKGVSIRELQTFIIIMVSSCTIFGFVLALLSLRISKSSMFIWRFFVKINN